MNKKQQDIAYFLSFCIEVLGKYGVLDYLAEHYELLHTQSRQWLMEDIDEYISLRRKEVV